MTENQILVPRKQLLEAKEFYAETDSANEKYGIPTALEACQTPDENGIAYEAIFMPAIIDTRNEAPNNSTVFQCWYTVPSIKATGRTKQGTPVVVYAHVPNYFSAPENIRKAIKQGLVNGAGRFPQTELQRLLDLEDGKNVFVVDHNTLKNSTNGVIPVNKALKHPQTIPFIGEEGRAINYLEKHKQVYGEEIGNWHLDDLADKPLARLLFVGDDYYGGLLGDGPLYGDARFLGVPLNAAEGSARKIFPAQEKLAGIINEYVAPINQPEVHERVAALYR